jgi:RNA polymerase sigma factor (sigma-70 family)
MSDGIEATTEQDAEQEEPGNRESGEHRGASEDDIPRPGEEALLIAISDIARRCARALLRSRDDADDVAQDVVLEALLKIRAGRWDADEKDLKKVVYWLVRHRLVDRRRRHDVRKQYDYEHLSDLEGRNAGWMSPQAGLRSAELSKLYQGVLWSVTPACREAYIRVREQGMSHAQVAAALNISRSTVNSYVVSVQHKMRRVMSENGIAVPAPKSGPGANGGEKRRVRRRPKGIRYERRDADHVSGQGRSSSLEALNPTRSG